MTEETSAEAAPAKSVAEQLDALFAPFDRTSAPGLVVAVSHKGEVIFRRGYGMASLETATANTPATRMRIGSTSKHFTALLALLLAEDGRFDLDAPIRTYIPELEGSSGDPSTRLLLQHRGGGRCYLDVHMLMRGMSSPPKGTALADLARHTGRNFAPGEAMIYNNGGYHLVSIALERAGGAPFEAQLKARLFDPLGMSDTASVPSDMVITPGVATFHLPMPDGAFRRGVFPSEEVRGEGAIISTVGDMLIWMAHLRARDRFGAPESWAQLIERPTLPEGGVGDYALGLMVDHYRDQPIVHHAGGVIGGSSQMLTVPDQGVDVIILCNGHPGANPVRLAEQVVDIVLADALGAPARVVPARDHPELIGRWWSAKTGLVYGLIDEDKNLALTFCGMPQGAKLRREDDGRVTAAAPGLGLIELDLDHASPEGGLTIRFAGQAATYRKLPAEARASGKLAEAVLGTYVSADAGATATVAREGEGLRIRFGDAHGSIEPALELIDEEVAATTPAKGVMHWSALTLHRDRERVTGFTLNSMRTRGLMFERTGVD